MKPVPIAALAAAVLAAAASLSIAQVPPPAGMPGTVQTATSARTQIEASGYTNIKELKRQDDGSWRAKATKNNIEVAVTVDSTGSVTQISQ